MIPHRTVEEILDATKIEEVVGDFVSLKRKGASYTACCPFHQEKTPSFYVTPSKGIFKCFGCGKSGTAVGFIMEHLGYTYVEALKYLAKKYNIEVQEKEDTPEELAARQRGESLEIVSSFAAEFFRKQLKETSAGQIGYAYFKSRGLTDETMEKFSLGWAPDSRWDLQRAAKAGGYKEEYLIDTGLCFRTEDGKVLDRFYNRVTFPITNSSGKVIAFTSRTLTNDKNISKYVNSPETEIYQKRLVLYGLSLAKTAIHKQDKVILVEGQMDVISMHQLGISNVVASSGTSLTVEQVRLLKKYTDNVTIIYDGDSAGIHAALRGINLVLQGGMNVRIVLLPDGDDPDSFSRKHSLEEVENFIADNEQDFIRFKSRLLLEDAGNDPIKKADLINDMADTIALIADPIKQSVYVQVVAEEFGVSENTIFSHIRKAREKARQDQAFAQQYKREEQLDADPAAVVQERRGYDSKPLIGNPLVNDKALAPCEEELLGFILKEGRTQLVFESDSPYFQPDAKPAVAEFIAAVLAEDETEFSNDTYRMTYNKYFEYYQEGLQQSQIIVRLMSDEDEKIRKVTEARVTEEYPITVRKFESSLTNKNTMLTMFVPRALLAYGKARVEKEIKQLTRSLAGDGDNTETLKRIQDLNNIKIKLTKKLGRV